MEEGEKERGVGVTSGIICQSNLRLTLQQEQGLTFIIIILIAVILSNRLEIRSINE